MTLPFYICRKEMERVNLKKFLQNNSSTILTGIGVIGIIGTAVLTAYATPRAIRLLENTEYEKGEPLTKLEKVKVAAPAYIPAALTGVATISCVVGANVLNHRQQASLMSAYALLDRSYADYRAKVKTLYGEDADKRVLEEIAKDDFEDYQFESDGEKMLFYDEHHRHYFESYAERAVLDDGMECWIVYVP